MDTEQISSRVMVARLSTSQWRPRKFDRKASDELAKLHGAKNASEIGRFNKILVDLASIKPLQQAYGELSTMHYSRTAPWSDDGARLLCAEMYLDYTKAIREKQQEIRSLARQFARVEYAAQIEAARKRLNGLFSEADYPKPDEVEAKFQVGIRFEPLPAPTGVRALSVSEEDRERIEREVREHLEEAVARAQRDVVDRVRRFDREESRALYVTAVENLRDVVGLVRDGLNVTGDERFTRLCQDIEGALLGVNAEALKNNATLRKGKTDEVEALAKKMAGVFGGAS